MGVVVVSKGGCAVVDRLLEPSIQRGRRGSQGGKVGGEGQAIPSDRRCLLCTCSSWPLQLQRESVLKIPGSILRQRHSSAPSILYLRYFRRRSAERDFLKGTSDARRAARFFYIDYMLQLKIIPNSQLVCIFFVCVASSRLLLVLAICI